MKINREVVNKTVDNWSMKRYRALITGDIYCFARAVVTMPPPPEGGGIKR